MLGSFDELVEFLLIEIAFAGERGVDVATFKSLVERFYVSSVGTGSGPTVGPHVAPLVDEKLLGSVWSWLESHDDVWVVKSQSQGVDSSQSVPDRPTEPVVVEITESQSVSNTDQRTDSCSNSLDDSADREGLNERMISASKPTVGPDQRMFTSQERVWQAVAGHGIDFARVPKLEFEALCFIAAAGPQGILQPDLVSLTRQDKRSLPRRTETLALKGYIRKETVYAKKLKTSLCVHHRYNKAKAEVHTGLSSSGEPSLYFQDGRLVFDHFIDFLERTIAVGDAMSLADFRQKTGAVEKGWERKAVWRCIERLDIIGVTQRCRLRYIDASGRSSNIASLRLLRKITPEDKKRYQSIPWKERVAYRERLRAIHQGNRAQRDAELKKKLDGRQGNSEPNPQPERSALIGLTNDADEPSLLDEVEDEGIPQEEQEEEEEDDDDDDDEADYQEPREEKSSAVVLRPQWDPSELYTTLVYNGVNESGKAGLTSMRFRELMFGSFYTRPLDNILGRLSDDWMNGQPAHLRHLSIIRDTAEIAKVAQYLYRTYSGFLSAENEGEVEWTSVLPLKIPKKKEQLGLDAWGFPLVSRSELIEPKASHSLAGCHERIQVSSTSTQEPVFMRDDGALAIDLTEPSNAMPLLGNSVSLLDKSSLTLGKTAKSPSPKVFRDPLVHGTSTAGQEPEIERTLLPETLGAVTAAQQAISHRTSSYDAEYQRQWRENRKRAEQVTRRQARIRRFAQWIAVQEAVSGKLYTEAGFQSIHLPSFVYERALSLIQATPPPLTGSGKKRGRPRNPESASSKKRQKLIEQTNPSNLNSTASVDHSSETRAISEEQESVASVDHNLLHGDGTVMKSRVQELTALLQDTSRIGVHINPPHLDSIKSQAPSRTKACMVVLKFPWLKVLPWFGPEQTTPPLHESPLEDSVQLPITEVAVRAIVPGTELIAPKQVPEHTGLLQKCNMAVKLAGQRPSYSQQSNFEQIFDIKRQTLNEDSEEETRRSLNIHRRSARTQIISAIPVLNQPSDILRINPQISKVTQHTSQQAGAQSSGSEADDAASPRPDVGVSATNSLDVNAESSSMGKASRSTSKTFKTGCANVSLQKASPLAESQATKDMTPLGTQVAKRGRRRVDAAFEVVPKVSSARLHEALNTADSRPASYTRWKEDLEPQQDQNGGKSAVLRASSAKQSNVSINPEIMHEQVSPSASGHAANGIIKEPHGSMDPMHSAKSNATGRSRSPARESGYQGSPERSAQLSGAVTGVTASQPQLPLTLNGLESLAPSPPTNVTDAQSGNAPISEAQAYKSLAVTSASQDKSSHLSANTSDKPQESTMVRDFEPEYMLRTQITDGVTAQNRFVRRKRGVGLAGGSMRAKRINVIVEAVRRAGGALGGDNEIVRPFQNIAHEMKLGATLPDRDTIIRSMRAAVEQRRLQRIKWSFKDRFGVEQQRHMLMANTLKKDSPAVQDMMQRIAKVWPQLFIPEHLLGDFKRGRIEKPQLQQVSRVVAIVDASELDPSAAWFEEHRKRIQEKEDERKRQVEEKRKQWLKEQERKGKVIVRTGADGTKTLRSIGPVSAKRRLLMRKRPENTAQKRTLEDGEAVRELLDAALKPHLGSPPSSNPAAFAPHENLDDPMRCTTTGFTSASLGVQYSGSNEYSRDHPKTQPRAEVAQLYPDPLARRRKSRKLKKGDIPSDDTRGFGMMDSSSETGSHHTPSFASRTLLPQPALPTSMSGEWRQLARIATPGLYMAIGPRPKRMIWKFLTHTAQLYDPNWQYQQYTSLLSPGQTFYATVGAFATDYTQYGNARLNLWLTPATPLVFENTYANNPYHTALLMGASGLTAYQDPSQLHYGDGSVGPRRTGDMPQDRLGLYSHLNETSPMKISSSGAFVNYGLHRGHVTQLSPAQRGYTPGEHFTVYATPQQQRTWTQNNNHGRSLPGIHGGSPVQYAQGLHSSTYRLRRIEPKVPNSLFASNSTPTQLTPPSANPWIFPWSSHTPNSSHASFVPSNTMRAVPVSYKGWRETVQPRPAAMTQMRRDAVSAAQRKEALTWNNEVMPRWKPITTPAPGDGSVQASALTNHTGPSREANAFKSRQPGDAAAMGNPASKISKIPNAADRELMVATAKRLFYACIVTRTLMGGASQTIDWPLVTKLCSFNQPVAQHVLEREWTSTLRKCPDVVEDTENDFQEAFLDAYERRVWPDLHVDSMEIQQWVVLVEWAETNISPKKKMAAFPINRRQLATSFTMKAEGQDSRNSHDNLFKEGTSLLCRHIAQHQIDFSVPLANQNLKQHAAARDDKLLLEKSWARASIATPEAVYEGDQSYNKLRQLDDTRLRSAMTQLHGDKLLAHNFGGRQRPNRNYHLGEAYTENIGNKSSIFSRLLDRSDIDDAVKLKRELDEFFSRDHPVFVPREDVRNGEIMLLIELVFHGRIKLAPKLPSINSSIGDPWPRISVWGLGSEGLYQAQKPGKEQLRWEVYYSPSLNYIMSVPLAPTLASLSIPQMPKQDPVDRARIPFWIDINGSLIRDHWQRVVVAIVQGCAIRAGSTIQEILRFFQGFLWEFEVFMAVEWMVEVGIVSWTRPGNGTCSVDGSLMDDAVDNHNNSRGLVANEWWWCLLGQLRNDGAPRKADSGSRRTE